MPSDMCNPLIEARVSTEGACLGAYTSGLEMPRAAVTTVCVCESAWYNAVKKRE